MVNNKFSIRISENSITTDKNTAIDLCFSEDPSLKVNIYETLFSDHKPLWFIIWKFNEFEEKKRKIKKLMMKKLMEFYHNECNIHQSLLNNLLFNNKIIHYTNV